MDSSGHLIIFSLPEKIFILQILRTINLHTYRLQTNERTVLRQQMSLKRKVARFSVPLGARRLYDISHK